VELIKLSGQKGGNVERKISLKQAERKKSIDLHRGISAFKKGYQPRTYWKMKMMICLQMPTVFWIDWGITSVSYWIYAALMILGRWKCTQLSHSICRRNFLVPSMCISTSSINYWSHILYSTHTGEKVKVYWNRT